MPRLTVEIWSDLACPWCYVGKRRFEAALARFPHRDAVDVTWRAFELDPAAPPVRDPATAYAARLAAKYGKPVAEAEAMIRAMTATAAADGLDLHFERIRPGNTFDAHRLLHLAAARGLGAVAHERLFRAYLTEGEAIGLPATLARLAAELGLDATEVAATLAGDGFARAVRAEQAEAQALGVRGVPFFVIGRRYGLSGAQPADVLLGALTQAWDELAVAPVAAGAACGLDGC